MQRSLRTIASELAALKHLAPSRQFYHASSVRHMLGGQALRPILIPKPRSMGNH
jgi:hypothetical protein